MTDPEMTPKRVARYARNERILRAAEGGATVVEIARAEGLAYSTVAQLCQVCGVKPPKPPTGRTTFPSTLRIVAQLINTDDSLAEIARRMGLTRQRVSQIYNQAGEAGIPVRLRLKGPGPNGEIAEAQPDDP